MISSPSPLPAPRPTSWPLPPSLPSPLRGSFEAPSSPAKENWTVSTLGFLSGIFDIESPEDEDDLLVPSTHRPLTAALNDVRELAPTPAQKRPAATQRRSCSAAFQAFLNEQALDEMVEPAQENASGLTLTLASTAMELGPSLLVTPPATANPLGLDWMNQSLGPDEFGDLLQEFDQEASASAASFPAHPSAVSSFAEHDVCTTVIDVSEVSFETLLSTQPAPLPFAPASAPAPACAPASSVPAPKKRGRPTKPAPTLQVTPRRSAAAPAPENLREASPATPFSPPCTPGGGISGTARPSPDDKEAYERYLRYRRTNNGSAQKSRLRRKEREKMNAEMVDTLQEQNSELKRELALLRGEFQQLQDMLDNYLQQQAKAN